jgi:hypothetical protein|tara:strand:+ start:19622 stop:21253 length:1632 start_codon:yes stop_codon:yes gene_type:complete
MAELFGFSLDKGDQKKKKQQGLVSPVAPNNDDGTVTISAGGYYGQYVDMEGVSKNEFQQIRKYREVSLHPEVDSAIDEVVNEAIVADGDDSPVEIELSNLDQSDSIKKRIREEFNEIKRLLQFDKKCYHIFRRWYIDGRLYYHKVIDVNKPTEGIKELRYIDPMKVKKMREVKKKPTAGQGDNQKLNYGDVNEYYLYNPKGIFNHKAAVSLAGNDQLGVKIAPDAITFCTSGLMDMNQNLPLSYLHKALKAVNQLRMIEDSLVIYRMSRAPERRIFYIDVGNLPKVKAEQYLREVMSRYRNKLVYDASTGEIRDDKKFMSMLEDFWLPRREGGRGTEITTLPGAQNLGELKDVEYFLKKLYKSLNLPPSRVGEEKGFSLGRSNEILRDELKFIKFVGRLRKQFSHLFNDMLKTQLILKGVITVDDWELMEQHIQYDYLFDNHFTELKEIEMIGERLNLVERMQPFLGVYYSNDHIKRQILQQKESEIEEIRIQIEVEKKSGELMDTPVMPVEDPNAALPPAGGPVDTSSKPPMKAQTSKEVEN